MKKASPELHNFQSLYVYLLAPVQLVLTTDIQVAGTLDIEVIARKRFRTFPTWIWSQNTNKMSSGQTSEKNILGAKIEKYGKNGLQNI